MRTALGMLSLHRLASVTELARAFGVSRPTVYRHRETYQAGGVEELSSKRGPRGGYKLKGDTREEAEKLLDQGRSLRAVARAVGVSHVALMNALRQGRLRRREPAAADPEAPESGSCPSARSVEDGQSLFWGRQIKASARGSKLPRALSRILAFNASALRERKLQEHGHQASL